MDSKIKELGETINKLQEIIHQKNLQLDAMAWVWCPGGCRGGIFRYTKLELTKEMVETAEYNVKRMRQRFNNMQTEISN